MKKGLVHFYLGNGKGKTTALFGLALRALGRDFRVLIVQVLKARDTGEILFFKKLNDNNLKIIRINTCEKFSWEMNNNEILQAKQEITNGIKEILHYYNEYDIVLFDELLNAESIGFIEEEEIKNIILNKNSDLELVFTGRKTKDSLKVFADYISNIEAEKHPYEKGIQSRIGIEF